MTDSACWTVFKESSSVDPKDELSYKPVIELMLNIWSADST